MRTVAELIDNDEDFAVEFKSTARWDVREARPNKAIEDAIVKTAAGFLNTDGGTLLIGVGPDRTVVGLGSDYPLVKPANGDGFVNWLTTHLANAFGHAAVMRTRARIIVHDGREICRLDVARSSRPVWAKTSKKDHVFYVRMNNSTRASSPTPTSPSTSPTTGLRSAPSNDRERMRPVRFAALRLRSAGRRSGVSAVHAFDGCYEARRAAALSGVPQSTVYDWARKGVVVPSISPEREKLWSYADLMALRIVSWLRHPKGPDDDQRPASAMREVRRALHRLDELGMDLWDGRAGRSPLFVDRAGEIIIVRDDEASDVSGQAVFSQFLDLLAPIRGFRRGARPRPAPAPRAPSHRAGQVRR